jgi:hypothetical protein
VALGKKDTTGLGSAAAGVARPRPGVVDFMAGEAKSFISQLQPYLPQDLIGGAIPHIPGSEEEAVWNAAAQACGTEKVHFVYTIENKKIWYLACPSASLASNPDSWCPLAAALPGNSEYWDKETVYLYEQEGVASALRWDPETGRMQVFLGASRTILPRIQTMDANFVTVNPEIAQIVPWRNRNLKTEQLSRATGRMLLISGMVVCLLSTLILVFNYLAINLIQRDLGSVKQKSEQASGDLMVKAYNAMQSDTIKHMVKIQEILDKLSKVDGTLVKYEVVNGKAHWEALVPPAFAQDFGTPQGLEKDGRARVKNDH